MRRDSGAGPRIARFIPVRRFVLALVVVSLTFAGHASGSGNLPSATGALLAVLIAGGLTLAATARQRSWPWLIAFLLGAQLLIHAVLAISTPHAHAATPLVPTGATAIGHVVASLIAAVVLARGEATLVAWSRLLSVTFGWPLPALPALVDVPAVPVFISEWLPILADCGWDSERRGPPRAVTA